MLYHSLPSLLQPQESDVAFNIAQNTTQEKDSLTTSEDTGEYCVQHMCMQMYFSISSHSQEGESLVNFITCMTSRVDTG